MAKSVFHIFRKDLSDHYDRLNYLNAVDTAFMRSDDFDARSFNLCDNDQFIDKVRNYLSKHSIVLLDKDHI